MLFMILKKTKKSHQKGHKGNHKKRSKNYLAEMIDQASKSNESEDI